jgi:hypothetical protein
MSGKKSRDKGARFERFLVLAQKVVFPDVHRGQQSHNPRHCDIEGTPFRQEAKHWAKLSYKNVCDALDQAEENGKRFDDDRVPVAITKVDGMPNEDSVVHMRLRYWLQMIEKHFYREPELADVIPIRGEEDE